MSHIVNLPADNSHEISSLTCVLTRKTMLSAANFRWFFRGFRAVFMAQVLCSVNFALLHIVFLSNSVSIPWVLLNHI